MRGKTCGLVGWTWKNKPIRRKTNKARASEGTRTHTRTHTRPRMRPRDTPPLADSIPGTSQESPPQEATQDDMYACELFLARSHTVFSSYM